MLEKIGDLQHGFPPRIFTSDYYRRKPGRLAERMDDLWCPEYEKTCNKNQEYIHIEEHTAITSALAEEVGRLKDAIRRSVARADYYGDSYITKPIREALAHGAGVENG